MSESLAHSGSSSPPEDAAQPAWLDDGVVITVNSNKGGVGKTTILLMVAYYLAKLLDELRYDFEILLIDWDPQCNLSTQLGFHMDGADGKGIRDENGRLVQGPLYSVDDIITTPIDEAGPGWAGQMIEPIRWIIRGANGQSIKHPVTGEEQEDPINRHIKLIPGHPKMEDRYTLISEADFRYRLDNALKGVKKRRIVLVDTGPGIGPLVEAAWAASDHVIGVAALYYNEMEGVLKSAKKIQRIRDTIQRPRLDMDGIVVNEYVESRSTQSRNLTQLVGALGEDRIWTEQAVPEIEQLAKIMDQGKSFGRLQGSVDAKKKINKAGEALARKVLEVIGGAR